MKNKIILLMLLSFVTAFSYQESYEVLAHSTMLDVVYDECEPSYYVDNNNIGDGIDEKWYELTGADNFCHHIYHSENKTTKVINYYVSQTSYEDDSVSVAWDDIVNPVDREKLITNIIQGMKEWENLYYYSVDENYVLIKTKLFKLNNTSFNDANIIIYPSVCIGENYGLTGVLSEFDYNEVEMIDSVRHNHYSKWRIRINLSLSSNSIEIIKLTGSHEFGHVIGLRDIENVEKYSLDEQERQNYVNHHDELLMGYGNNSSKNITYKDLAGVMITMGFHTANDHKWLYDVNGYTGSVVENEYKLICSICNGVKYVSSLTDIDYDVYRECDNNHSLSSGKMMPVASYGNKDYIKCKYCRYVAPFEERVQQEYIYTKKNSTIHTITNDVEGLTYTFEEKHGDYSYSVSNKSGKHLKRCGGCNYIIEEPHAVSLEDYMDGNNTVTCRGCNRTFDKNSGQFVINNINELQRTENGSYILPNGIIILVEEDIQAYLDGTLIFRDGNSEIM